MSADFIVQKWENDYEAGFHPAQLHRLHASGRVDVRYYGEWIRCTDCQPPITPIPSTKEQV